MQGRAKMPLYLERVFADTDAMEVEAATQSRLIGAILVEHGLITREQLHRALELQQETGERLGEIVVAEFNVTRIELASLIAEQWAALEGNPPGGTFKPVSKLRVVAAPQDDTSADRRPIGQIFLELGFINQEQLDAALERQRTTGERIGEVLVEQGSLTRLDLASALAEQWTSLEKLRPPSPAGKAQGPTLADDDGAAPETNDAAIDPRTLRAYEDRLAAIEESMPPAMPGAAELEVSLAELRASLSSLEARVKELSRERLTSEDLSIAADALETRITALEGGDASDALANLRLELDDLRSQPNLVAAVAELRAMVERLEDQPATLGQIEGLASEVAALGVRLDGLLTSSDLETRVEAAAIQAEAAGNEARRLSVQIEALSGLEHRLDEIVGRVPSEGAIDGLVEQFRSELAVISAGRSESVGEGSAALIASIASRVDLLSARLDDLVSKVEPDLQPSLDALAERIEATEASSATQARGLGERIASLENSAREGGGVLERITADLEELDSRTREYFDDLDKRPTDPAPLEAAHHRLDDLAEFVAQLPTTGSFEDIDARISALTTQQDAIAPLESRVCELEARLGTIGSTADLRDEIRQVVESTAAERASLEEALMARVEEIASSEAPRQELAELRARVDQVALMPSEDDAVRQRVEALASRLDALGGLETSIDDVRELILGVDAAQAAISQSGEARFAGLEVALEESNRRARIETLNEFEASIANVRESIAEAEGLRVADALASGSRLAGVERALGALATQEAVDGALADLRGEINTLAAAPITEQLDERIAELAARIDRIASDAADSVVGVAKDLTIRIDRNAAEVGTRVDDLADNLAGLVDQQALDAAAARHVEWVRSELATLAAAGDERAACLEDSLEAIDLARRKSETALNAQVDTAVASIWSALRERQLALDPQLEAQSAELAALRAQVAELHEDRSARAGLEVRFEGRITSEIAAARAFAEDEIAVARSDLGELGARIDELLGLRTTDLEAARAVEERVVEQVGALAARIEDEQGMTRSATTELALELGRLAESLSAGVEAVRVAGEQAGIQLNELQAARAEDAAAAAHAGGELVGRLDELEVRSSASVAEVELRLRADLDAVASRLEELDGANIEARDELRSELERLAASMGWRLERIEESLAADEGTALRATVDRLDRQLEAQSALGEEQARATERALRKGLASLGERLIDSESAYVEAGNTLRRSIERLGAAVVEADARMADQIPVSPLDGCVAFAPTDDGYRLIELEGERPEVGATVEVDVCDVPLVVTRYGRSPLPFDGRPCAYLDRG